jgi:circadian clock protein KaiC
MKKIANLKGQNAVSELAEKGVGRSRCSTGIRGLDAVLDGGLPRGRTTIVVGGPGAGKTILGAQFLIQGAACFDEPGLLVSFEESKESMQSNFSSLELPFSEMLGNKLHIIDGRIPLDSVETGSFDLSGLIAGIASQTKTLGLQRIVLDGIDAVFAYTQNAANSRREVQRLMGWLATSGLTAILTVKSSGDQPVPANLEFLEYASDGVIKLDYRLIGNVLLRKLWIVKLRGCGYMAGEHGYIISERGIEMASTGREKTVAPLSQNRLSTGVGDLDKMLGGGYREGSITLVSGLPGTAKTTLAGAFLEAGCALKKSALLIGLDETPDQIVLDLRSIGLNLREFQAQGLLHTVSINAGAVSNDEQFVRIERLLDRHDPALLVLDPITAYGKSMGGFGLIEEMTERLAALFKARGVTAIFTAVADSRAGELESTSIRVSTIADTWIHVSYAVQNGERNRTLTIIKSRGIGHSNQVRELVLGSDGISLRKVSFAQGAMLLGTARLEREQQEIAIQLARREEVEGAIRALEARGVALAARDEETHWELADLEKQKEKIIAVANENEKIYIADRDALLFNMQTNPARTSRRRPAAGRKIP